MFFFSTLAEYNKDLEEWLCSDTSGHFRTLVRSLLTAEREETVEIDFEMAELDAQRLFDVGIILCTVKKNFLVFCEKHFVYTS